VIDKPNTEKRRNMAEKIDLGDYGLNKVLNIQKHF
jgi:hypothetical protein